MTSAVEQDQAPDQYLQETVDIDVVEAVVEDAEHEQADDGIADAAAAAEQAGAADHDGGDRIEQIGVELVLLRAAEMRDAEHAADPKQTAEITITLPRISFTLSPEYSAASRFPPTM